MPRIALTDIVLKSLKPQPRQVQYWDASLPAFACRVNPRGTKTFNVMIGDKRRLIKIGNYPDISLAIARQRAHKLMEENDPHSISFVAARDFFSSGHLDTLKPTTAHDQKNLMRRFPFTGALASITANDVARVLEAMPRGSARSCFNVFRTFLNWCVAQDHLKASPLRRSPYKPQFRDRLLTDDEIRLIWAESFKHGTFGTIVRCLVLSGQRLNQIASFDPSWISGDTIIFPPEIMKSNKRHAIPLTPVLAAELRRHRLLKGFSRPMAAFRAQLDIPHWTLHDARRFFYSSHAAIGTELYLVARLVDHTTGSETPISRIYNRYSFANELRVAQLNYEAHIASITGSTPHP